MLYFKEVFVKLETVLKNPLFIRLLQNCCFFDFVKLRTEIKLRCKVKKRIRRQICSKNPK